MTASETPKRRGRPPGAKNKPKAIYHPPYDDGESTPLGATRTFEPASIESYTLGPVGVRVAATFGVAMSKEGVTELLDWPTGWPIPQLNDVIRTATRAGRVRWVEYDYGAGIIRISLA